MSTATQDQIIIWEGGMPLRAAQLLLNGVAKQALKEIHEAVLSLLAREHGNSSHSKAKRCAYRETLKLIAERGHALSGGGR